MSIRVRIKQVLHQRAHTAWKQFKVDNESLLFNLHLGRVSGWKGRWRPQLIAHVSEAEVLALWMDNLGLILNLSDG